MGVVVVVVIYPCLQWLAIESQFLYSHVPWCRKRYIHFIINMSLYVGFKKQTSLRNSYSPDQGCACGSCNILTTTQEKCNKTEQVEDWQGGLETCCGNLCPQRRVCVPPDVTECAIGVNDQGLDPFDSVTWNGRAPNLACKYKADLMTSSNVIENYRNRFGRDDNWKLMMEKFCATETNTCTIDPLTGRPFDKCSNINSISDVGDQCRLFYNAESDNVKDTIVQNYCAKHGTNADCKCIDRALDPKYRAVKPHIPFNDGCWYPACATSAYLRTQDLVGPTCPSNVCQIVFDNLNNNNVNISENKNAITCQFNEPVKPPPPPPPPPPVKSPVSVTALVIIGIVVFLTIVALLAAASRRRT
jgi:hypothetical protein